MVVQYLHQITRVSCIAKYLHKLTSAGVLSFDSVLQCILKCIISTPPSLEKSQPWFYICQSGQTSEGQLAKYLEQLTRHDYN